MSDFLATGEENHILNELALTLALPYFRQLQPVGTESLNSVVCYSARLPNRAYLKFSAHEGEVNALHWSPVDGGLLATAGADRKIKLWDVGRGHAELRGTLVGSNGAVMAIDMESGGELLLAASSSDFASRVWGVADHRLRHTLTGHSGKVEHELKYARDHQLDLRGAVALRQAKITSYYST